MTINRAALYLQDAHPLQDGIRYAQYAEQKGFEAVWQAESRLVRDAKPARLSCSDTISTRAAPPLWARVSMIGRGRCPCGTGAVGAAPRKTTALPRTRSGESATAVSFQRPPKTTGTFCPAKVPRIIVGAAGLIGIHSLGAIRARPATVIWTLALS